MLYQLHWQNPKELSQTIMVMQGEANSPDECDKLRKAFADKLRERRDECPEGWQPFVCDETSNHFWWSKPVEVRP